MVLKPDFTHLEKCIDKTFRLKQWGGDLEFDFNEYIAWRAEEEGVNSMLTDDVRR